MEKLLTREEVPVEQTWNLADLFANEEAWATAYAEIEEKMAELTAFKGRLGEGAATYLACYQLAEALVEKLIRVSTYAGLRAAEDGSNPANQVLAGKAASLEARFGAAISFLESESLALPEGTLEGYLEAEPGLAPYRREVEKVLTKKPYTLSTETEEAIAALGETLDSPYMIYERAKSSDMRFAPITGPKGEELSMSFARWEDHYEDNEPNTDQRRKAWASFSQGLQNYQNTLGATFATEVNKNVTLARLRGYQGAEEMLLHRNHEVTLEIYHNLLDTIQAELAPHMRRFAQLKKRVLGLDELRFCDLKAPLDTEYHPQFSFAEAKEILLKALAPMGPEYLAIMETALTERWCDLADNVGKGTGAFCASPYGAHSYILITWTNSMQSLFTMAHELGHAGHFQLANKYNNLFNTDVSSFFVEAPSTLNELLVADYLTTQHADPKMKRRVTLQMLGTYYHNFITHLLEGELQRRTYALAEQGQPLTAQALSQVKGEILANFWGDTVVLDEGAKLTWMRQPHYYMGLYPYTYSAGLTLSTAVAQLIKAEGQPAIDRWLEVLKAGSTRSPLGLAQMAGVEMGKPEAIKQAVAHVGSLVDQLEASF